MANTENTWVGTGCSTIVRLPFINKELVELNSLAGKSCAYWHDSVDRDEAIAFVRGLTRGDALLLTQCHRADWGLLCSVYVKTGAVEVTEFCVTISAGRYVCHEQRVERARRSVYQERGVVRNIETLVDVLDVIRDTLGHKCTLVQRPEEQRSLVRTIFPLNELVEQLAEASLAKLLWITPHCSSVRGFSMTRISDILNRARAVVPNKTPVALVCDCNEVFPGYLFSLAIPRQGLLWAAVVFSAYGCSVYKYDDGGKLSARDEDYIESGWNIERLLIAVAKDHMLAYVPKQERF